MDRVKIVCWKQTGVHLLHAATHIIEAAMESFVVVDESLVGGTNKSNQNSKK